MEEEWKRRTEYKTIESWRIPPNNNGNLWKKNKRFKDEQIEKIIQKIDINNWMGNMI